MTKRGQRLLAFCAGVIAGTLTLAIMAAPAGAQVAATSATPRLVVSGAPALYDQPLSLELLLALLGLSVQVSNGYIGATGSASLVQVACALPLSETGGLGSVCVYSGDNANQPWDLGASVDHDCQGGGTVDALDQPGQDQNVTPVDYGAVALRLNFSSGSPFPDEDEDAEFYGG
jgi:hypothetical protein